MGKRKFEEEIIKKEEFGSDDEAEEIRSKVVSYLQIFIIYRNQKKMKSVL